jgi:hypothetical protein
VESLSFTTFFGISKTNCIAYGPSGDIVVESFGFIILF